jgi:hypothetical protein
MEGAKSHANIDAIIEAQTQAQTHAETRTATLTEPQAESRAARTLGNMNNADFSFMSIDGGGFRNLHLSEALFTSMQGTNVRWENCLLEASTFSSARFDNAVFSRCQLHRANFEGTVGADWVSLLPNRFTASIRSWNALITAEPVSFALSLESRARLNDPIHRVGLLKQSATMASVSDGTETAFHSEADTPTLLDNIFALPSATLRQKAMTSLIDALNVQMNEGDRLDDVNDLLPLLCHTDYVGNPVISAFLERRITGLLSDPLPGATVASVDAL